VGGEHLDRDAAGCSDESLGSELDMYYFLPEGKDLAAAAGLPSEGVGGWMPRRRRRQRGHRPNQRAARRSQQTREQRPPHGGAWRCGRGAGLEQLKEMLLNMKQLPSCRTLSRNSSKCACCALPHAAAPPSP